MLTLLTSTLIVLVVLFTLYREERHEAELRRRLRGG